MNNHLQIQSKLSPQIPDIQNKFYGTYEDKKTGRILIKDLPESTGNDCFYRRMNLIAQNSATAKRAIEVMHSFIVADGFQDRNFAESNPNMFQKWDDLLSEIAYSYMYHEGFVLNVFPSITTGQIEKIESLPFYRTIRTNRNTFIINPRFKDEKGYNKNDDIEYFAYKNNLTTQDRVLEAERQLKEYGRNIGYILYCYTEKPMEEYYPIPSWHPLEYDLRLEPEYSQMEFGQVRNGFKGTKLIAHPSMSIGRQLDENGNEIIGSSEYEGFVSQVQKASDPGSHGATILTEIKTSLEGKEIPVKVFDLNPFVGGSDIGIRKDNIVQNICRGFGVPPVLVGVLASGGIGDTKQLSDEIQLLNDKINKIQRFISSKISLIANASNTEISTHNPINYIPDSVMSKMTDDEIRALAGLEPLPSTKSNDTQQKIIDTIGAMSPLVAAEVMRRMSDEQVLALIGLTPQQTTQ